MTRQIESTNTYKDVLLKLIPSEIVAAYMVIDGLTSKESYAKWAATCAVAVLLGLIPFYLWRLYKVRRWLQIIFTMGSFVVWVYWMGGPFKYWEIHYPPIASIILVLWTLLIPLILLPLEFNKGQKVKIIPNKPKDIETPGRVFVWNNDMNKLRGRSATVVKVDSRERSVKLDVDGGVNEWPFEWVESVKTNGKENA